MGGWGWGGWGAWVGKVRWGGVHVGLDGVGEVGGVKWVSLVGLYVGGETNTRVGLGGVFVRLGRCV